MVMNGVFGSPTNTRLDVTMVDAMAPTNRHIGAIEAKIRKLDSELLRLKEELANYNQGPANVAIQDWVIRILRQKQQYETQLALLEQQSLNMERAGFASGKLRNAMIATDAMEIINKEQPQEQYGRLDIDNINCLHDEVQEMSDQGNEVQEVVSRSYAVPDEVNEEDLQAELDALSFDAGETSYLDEVVSQPIHLDLKPLEQNGITSKPSRSEPARIVVTTDP